MTRHAGAQDCEPRVPQSRVARIYWGPWSSFVSLDRQLRSTVHMQRATLNTVWTGHTLESCTHSFSSSLATTTTTHWSLGGKLEGKYVRRAKRGGAHSRSSRLRVRCRRGHARKGREHLCNRGELRLDRGDEAGKVELELRRGGVDELLGELVLDVGVEPAS